MTQKFKVGDKVLINELSRFGADYIGEVGVVDRAIPDEDGDISVQVDGKGRCYLSEHLTLVNAKLTQDKPKKKQRLSELERQVAELQAEVASLKAAQKPTVHIGKATVTFTQETPKLSANEQRKAIIAEAKAFVEDAKNFVGISTKRNGYKYATTRRLVCDAEFIVDAEKRTVVALLRKQISREVSAKAIAKCAPDDVFNADIGKAIALGRALGLDVKRFEQAVKPTEVVVGQVVRGAESQHSKFVTTITKRYSKMDGIYGKAFKHTKDKGWIGVEQVVITEDTEAQY